MFKQNKNRDNNILGWSRVYVIHRTPYKDTNTPIMNNRLYFGYHYQDSTSNWLTLAHCHLGIVYIVQWIKSISKIVCLSFPFAFVFLFEIRSCSLHFPSRMKWNRDEACYRFHIHHNENGCDIDVSFALTVLSSKSIKWILWNFQCFGLTSGFSGLIPAQLNGIMESK